MPKLPKAFTHFSETYPDLSEAYEALAGRCHKAGPLSKRERALVKLGIAIGARQEGALHSHTRKALELGILPEEIRHVAILALTTVGFPNMMAALTWMDDLLPAKEKNKGRGSKRRK